MSSPTSTDNSAAPVSAPICSSTGGGTDGSSSSEDVDTLRRIIQKQTTELEMAQCNIQLLKTQNDRLYAKYLAEKRLSQYDQMKTRRIEELEIKVKHLEEMLREEVGKRRQVEERLQQQHVQQVSSNKRPKPTTLRYPLTSTLVPGMHSQRRIYASPQVSPLRKKACNRFHTNTNHQLLRTESPRVAEAGLLLDGSVGTVDVVVTDKENQGGGGEPAASTGAGDAIATATDKEPDHNSSCVLQLHVTTVARNESEWQEPSEPMFILAKLKVEPFAAHKGRHQYTYFVAKVSGIRTTTVTTGTGSHQLYRVGYYKKCRSQSNTHETWFSPYENQRSYEVDSEDVIHFLPIPKQSRRGEAVTFEFSFRGYRLG